MSKSENGRGPEIDSGGDSGPTLLPQKHGGALLSGGVPGNRGGIGTPPAELRGAMRDILEEGLPHLREFVTDNRKKERPVTCPECEHEFTIKLSAVMPKDQLKAIEIAGRLGLTKEGYDKQFVDHLWEATALVLEQVADGEKLAAEIQNGWVPILARKMMANT